jgi:hypothetical protein
MDHIAILRKSKIGKKDNLLGDIISGDKTIESRWYINKSAPWTKIKPDDNIYFKESGCPVSANAKVSDVIQFENLNSVQIEDIINKYGNRIAPRASKEGLRKWAISLNKKNYCMLIFLKEVRLVKPFMINKSGFGNACAWLIVGSINKVKL